MGLTLGLGGLWAPWEAEVETLWSLPILVELSAIRLARQKHSIETWHQLQRIPVLLG